MAHLLRGQDVIWPFNMLTGGQPIGGPPMVPKEVPLDQQELARNALLGLATGNTKVVMVPAQPLTAEQQSQLAVVETLVELQEKVRQIAQRLGI